MPDDHLAWFVSDVVDWLDLSQLTEEYLHLAGGRPGFHPVMMVKLLVYAYSVGGPTSLRIERKAYEPPEDVEEREMRPGSCIEVRPKRTDRAFSRLQATPFLPRP